MAVVAYFDDDGLHYGSPDDKSHEFIAVKSKVVEAPARLVPEGVQGVDVKSEDQDADAT